MIQTAVITEAITSLTNAHTRFGLVRVEDVQFFPEWSKGLPKITEAEKISLDVVRRRYLYHCGEGDVLEGTVIVLVVFP
ncbi:hypothetical protein [Nostoc sp.]|uniref:hypothetical protein n=1 Tax=Nostoc sp. TaxID=1180 RepID=UPI002FFA6844